MRAFKFLPPALEEMSEAAEYYEGCAPGLGGEFLAEVRSGGSGAEAPWLLGASPSMSQAILHQAFPVRRHLRP